MLVKREGPNAPTGCRKYRVGERGNKGDRPYFARSPKRPRAAVDEKDLDRRHFRHTRNLIVVIIALDDPALFKSDFGLNGVREAKDHAALERIGRYSRIEHGPRIGHDDDAMNLDRS